MARKREAREKFYNSISNALKEIKTNEAAYMTINNMFEISPFIGYFSAQVKEMLFKLVFNEQLLDFLKEKLDAKISGGRLLPIISQNHGAR
jgi:hypothetical protein